MEGREKEGGRGVDAIDHGTTPCSVELVTYGTCVIFSPFCFVGICVCMVVYRDESRYEPSLWFSTPSPSMLLNPWPRLSPWSMGGAPWGNIPPGEHIPPGLGWPLRCGLKPYATYGWFGWFGWTGPRGG